MEQGLLDQIVKAVMIGLLGWMAWTINDVSKNQVTFATEITHMKDSIEQLEASSKNPGVIMTEEARRAVAIIDQRLARLENSHEEIQKRLVKIERDFDG